MLRSFKRGVKCHQDLLSLMGMGSENEASSHEVVSYRAGIKTGWVDLEKLRENCSVLNLPACLTGMDFWFQGNAS